MTRFARAHGSKASNERQPEEATSWNVLKQQLLEQQAATKNKVEEVTKPTKQHFVFQPDKTNTTEWAEFEETPNPNRKKVAKKEKKLKPTEEQFVGRPGLADKDQHSIKTKLHKIEQTSNVHTDKKLAKKLKQIEENELKPLHSDFIKLKKLAKKEKQLKLSDEQLVDKPGLADEEQHSSKTKLYKIEQSSNVHTDKKLTKKLKQIKGNKLKTLPSDVIKLKKVAKKEKLLKLSDEQSADKPGLVDEEQHSSKTKLHKIENFSKVHRSTDKKLTKKLKEIKGNKLKNLHSKDLGTVVIKDEVQVKISKREKRNNKVKVSKKSIETLSPNSQETNSELKMSESVDGGERQLSKKQLKRKRQLLKKRQDDGFVLKRPKLEEVNDPIPSHVETSVNGNDVNRDETKLSKRQKNKRRSQLKKQQSSTLINTPSNEETVKSDDHTKSDTKFQAQSKRQKRNLKKLGDPTHVKQHKRRKPYVQTTTMVINGQEIEVTMLDGFPVRKQDADRLKELRKQMVDNGIPATEIEETMKLERRKAEKALTRERRKVCFHCRKGGHNLSECPELNEGSNQDAAGSGICFKCGSTEHTHFECRVVRGQEFRFAKCFICQEQGHISRQCPDNPRGLYPKGGGCKVCGDVTHLKKDCPDLHEKKEQNIITLDTARSDQLEVLDEELRTEVSQPVVSAPKNKIIKF